MTSIAFDANVVSVHDVNNALVLVAFSDDQDNPTRYFVLQRSLEPDEQDLALGHDTYHVEWCGQQVSVYGGIKNFTLGIAGANIRFATAAAEALGGMTELTLTLDLSVVELEALGRRLEALFAGTDCVFQPIPNNSFKPNPLRGSA